MTKRQFSFLLGLVCQGGCIVYEDNLRRHAADAADVVVRDAGGAGRDVSSDTFRVDVALLDAIASLDASADGGADSDAPSPGDAGDALSPDTSDVRDATSDQLADTGMLETGSDVRTDVVDAGLDNDVIDGSVIDAPVDPTIDSPIVGCTVDFTVSGVIWDVESAADAGDGGAPIVRLVGDIGTLGAWSPASGLAMTEKAPGAWSTTIWLSDRLTIEFKFVKLDGVHPPEWEAWLPADSNRSLLVDCRADGGPIWVDASADAGQLRAVGRSYGGAFGMRPLDATK